MTKIVGMEEKKQRPEKADSRRGAEKERVKDPGRPKKRGEEGGVSSFRIGGRACQVDESKATPRTEWKKGKKGALNTSGDIKKKWVMEAERWVIKTKTLSRRKKNRERGEGTIHKVICALAKKKILKSLGEDKKRGRSFESAEQTRPRAIKISATDRGYEKG